MPKVSRTKVKRLARKRKARLQIEQQTVIAEVRTKSIEVVRLSRIKYRENDYKFIDFRVFLRGFDERENEIFYPTARGVQMKEEDFNRLVDAHFANEVERRIRS